MLVLARRVGEAIIIDGNIQICVITMQGDRVRLGITAPDSVRVDRQEVHARRAAFAAEADLPAIAFTNDGEANRPSRAPWMPLLSQ